MGFPPLNIEEYPPALSGGYWSNGPGSTASHTVIRDKNSQANQQEYYPAPLPGAFSSEHPGLAPGWSLHVQGLPSWARSFVGLYSLGGLVAFCLAGDTGLRIT